MKIRYWILAFFVLATMALDRSCAWAAPPSPPQNVQGFSSRCVYWYQEVCSCPVTISWREPADNGGFPIVAYRVYQDGVPLDWTGWINTSATNHIGEGTEHSWTVSAFNSNLEEGLQSDPVQVTARMCDEEERPTEPGGVLAVAVDCDTAWVLWNPSVCPTHKAIERMPDGSWKINPPPRVIGYRIFRTTPGGLPLGYYRTRMSWAGRDSFMWVDDTVEPGLYLYGIEALCLSGELSPLAITSTVEIPEC